MSSKLLVTPLQEVTESMGFRWSYEKLRNVASQIFSIINSLPEYHHKKIVNAYTYGEKAIRVCFKQSDNVEDLILNVD